VVSLPETYEEREWLFVEYTLRRAMCKYDGVKVKFLAIEIID